MRAIAFDLEMDQPSGRIIQIGAVSFDTDHMEITGHFNHFIEGEVNWDYPLRRRNMTLGELLPFDQGVIDSEGQPADEVMRDFWLWVGSQQAGKRLIQWGQGDCKELINQSIENNVARELYTGVKPFNLKAAYQFMFQRPLGMGKKGSLYDAITQVNHGHFMGGDPHNAYADAYSTAHLFMHLYNKVNKLGKIEEILND